MIPYAIAAVIAPIVLDIENKSVTTMNRATLLSIFAMFGDLTAASANVVIGKTADISTSFGFVTCVGMSIFAYVLLMVYKKKSLKEAYNENRI